MKCVRAAIVGFLLLRAFVPAWAQADPKAEAEKEARKALEKFEKAYSTDVQSARIAALQQLAFVRRDLAIATLLRVLTTDADAVRIAAAEALGRINDPAAVKALGESVARNATHTEVMDAIVKAIETLDWEVGVDALNPLLARENEKDVVDTYASVVPALGKLGSHTSVEPLIALLDHCESAARISAKSRDRRAEELAKLKETVIKALKGITGWKEKRQSDWADRWAKEGPQLVAERTAVYLCRNVDKRWEQGIREKPKCPYDDKASECGVLVKTKLH